MNPYQPGEDNQDPYEVGYKAGAASRDAEVVSLTNQRDYEYVRAENAASRDAEIAELVEDKGRLDFLDGNSKFKMGWSVGQSPVGNLSISAVIQLGKEPTTIREAIDTALAKVRKP